MTSRSRSPKEGNLTRETTVIYRVTTPELLNVFVLISARSLYGQSWPDARMPGSRLPAWAGPVES